MEKTTYPKFDNRGIQPGETSLPIPFIHTCTTDHILQTLKAQDLFCEELQKVRIIAQGERGGQLIADVGMQDDLPRVLFEAYRLLEHTFTTIGGGTGKYIKDDRYNTVFRQLLTLDPKTDTLLFFYRYGVWSDIAEKTQSLDTPMTSFFDFTPQRIAEHKDKVVELGTAGVALSREGKGAIASARTGLAWVMEKHKKTHFVGKLTIEANYPLECTKIVLAYLQQYYTKMPSPSAIPKPDKKVLLYDTTGKEEIDLSSYLPKGLTGVYTNDKNLLQVAIENASKGKTKRLPGMFGEYLSRIPKEGLEYIGSIQNGNNIEAGIVVELAKINEDQIDNRFAGVQAFIKTYPEGISLADYKKIVLDTSKHKE